MRISVLTTSAVKIWVCKQRSWTEEEIKDRNAKRQENGWNDGWKLEAETRRGRSGSNPRVTQVSSSWTVQLCYCPRACLRSLPYLAATVSLYVEYNSLSRAQRRQKVQWSWLDFELAKNTSGPGTEQEKAAWRKVWRDDGRNIKDARSQRRNGEAWIKKSPGAEEEVKVPALPLAYVPACGSTKGLVRGHLVFYRVHAGTCQLRPHPANSLQHPTPATVFVRWSATWG